MNSGIFSLAACVSGEMLLRNVAHRRIGGIAVLGQPVTTARGIGAIEERDEVAQPEPLERAPDAVAIGDRRRQRHVAAIADAGDHDAVLVELRTSRDPIEQRADILDRILAIPPVVEMLVGLAKADRPADIRVDDGHAELVAEVVAPPQRSRPLTRSGPPCTLMITGRGPVKRFAGR